MDTNFHMLQDLLKEFKPKNRGIISGEEIKLVTDKLHLKDMNLLELQNLRDFTVMFLGVKEDRVDDDVDKRMEISDIMSAITYVIDTYKIKLGGEV